MRAVVQRVKKASVCVDNKLISNIENGLLVLLGIENNDSVEDLNYIYKKITNLRIFDDECGNMNKSLLDMGLELLVVSQFTLYGDARKGNRPSYTRAAKFDEGIKLYEALINLAKADNIPIKCGQYGADMDVELVNSGPVTILIDSNKEF